MHSIRNYFYEMLKVFTPKGMEKDRERRERTEVRCEMFVEPVGVVCIILCKDCARRDAA